MAATLKLDIVNGSGIIVEGLSARYTRRGLVKDIDLPDVASPLALLNVLAVPGMPNMQDQLDPLYPNLTLTRLRVEPIDRKNTYVSLDYETPSGFTPTIYILRDEGGLTTRQESVLPDGTPLETAFQTDTGDEVGPVTMPLRFLRPVRSVSIQALVYGRPSSSAADYLGYVNQTAWPAAPGSAPGVAVYDPGWWLMTKYTSTWNRNGGYYIVDAQASTRVICDWSETDVMIDPRTGQHPPIVKADVADVLSQPYDPYATFGYDFGVIRACGYPWVPLQDLFGF